MTDQIPADKVRPILDEWERIKEHADWEDMDNLVQDVRALLPPPPPPTLADMTDEEQEECQRMQCDVRGRKTSGVIVSLYCRAGRARVLWPDGFVGEIDLERVTPRPDLPRLEWPDTGQGADTSDAVPESTLAVGSVWDDARAFSRACREAGLDKVVVADCDGDVDVWDVRRSRWICGGSTPRFSPYTIIHTGRKADQ